jgi:hypothetical protein
MNKQVLAQCGLAGFERTISIWAVQGPIKLSRACLYISRCHRKFGVKRLRPICDIFWALPKSKQDAVLWSCQQGNGWRRSKDDDDDDDDTDEPRTRKIWKLDGARANLKRSSTNPRLTPQALSRGMVSLAGCIRDITRLQYGHT